MERKALLLLVTLYLCVPLSLHLPRIPVQPSRNNLIQLSLLWSANTGPFTSTPAVVDLNGDGIKDIALGHDYGLIVLNGRNGSTLWTASALLEVQDPPLIVDLNGMTTRMSCLATTMDISMRYMDRMEPRYRRYSSEAILQAITIFCELPVLLTLTMMVKKNWS